SAGGPGSTAEHRLREGIRSLDGRQVAARLDDLQARAADAVPVALAVRERHQAVLAAPEDERRSRHAAQAPLELRIVQVGVPADFRRDLEGRELRQDER